MIFEMLQEKMFPKFDEEPVNPFDPWDGANFNIKMVGKVLGKDIVPDYTKSSFGEPSPMCKGDDEEIERVYGEAYKLSEFTAPTNFKSEDELKRKLFDVLGPTVGSGVVTVEGLSAPAQAASRPAPKIREDDDEKAASKATVVADDSDEDEDLAFLKKLVSDID